MKNTLAVAAAALTALFAAPASLLALTSLAPDAAGVEIAAQFDIQSGPVLTAPPLLPVPVLPGSTVRLTVHNLSPNQISDVSWSKNAVSLGEHGNELVLRGVGATDTGQYLATVTMIDGEVVLSSRVLHVSAFPRQRLLNLSTRASVPFAGSTVIAGFVVDAGPGDSSSSKLLLIRAVGPSLEDYGVRGTLADPALHLFRGDGSEILVGESARDPDRIAEAARRTGAAPLRAGAADQALLISLRGGVYTAHLGSTASHTGEVLFEIYEVPAEDF